MDDYTKENPGCYHSMIDYLSEITGISKRKDIRLDNVWMFKSGKKRLRFKSHNITVVDKDGQKHSYIDSQNKRFDQRGIVADYFIANITRPIEEFGIEIKSIGTYKDSLGGGWYQNVSMLQINDKFFAMMDCAHSNND